MLGKKIIPFIPATVDPVHTYLPRFTGELLASQCEVSIQLAFSPEKLDAVLAGEREDVARVVREIFESKECRYSMTLAEFVSSFLDSFPNRFVGCYGSNANGFFASPTTASVRQDVDLVLSVYPSEQDRFIEQCLLPFFYVSLVNPTLEDMDKPGRDAVYGAVKSLFLSLFTAVPSQGDQGGYFYTSPRQSNNGQAFANCIGCTGMRHSEWSFLLAYGHEIPSSFLYDSVANSHYFQFYREPDGTVKSAMHNFAGSRELVDYVHSQNGMYHVSPLFNRLGLRYSFLEAKGAKDLTLGMRVLIFLDILRDYGSSLEGFQANGSGLIKKIKHHILHHYPDSDQLPMAKQDVANFFNRVIEGYALAGKWTEQAEASVLSMWKKVWEACFDAPLEEATYRKKASFSIAEAGAKYLEICGQFPELMPALKDDFYWLNSILREDLGKVRGDHDYACRTGVNDVPHVEFPAFCIDVLNLIYDQTSRFPLEERDSHSLFVLLQTVGHWKKMDYKIGKLFFQALAIPVDDKDMIPVFQASRKKYPVDKASQESTFYSKKDLNYGLFMATLLWKGYAAVKQRGVSFAFPVDKLASLNIATLSMVDKQRLLLAVSDMRRDPDMWTLYLDQLFQGDVLEGIRCVYDRLSGDIPLKVSLAKRYLEEKWQMHQCLIESEEFLRSVLDDMRFNSLTTESRQGVLLAVNEYSPDSRFVSAALNQVFNGASSVASLDHMQMYQWRPMHKCSVLLAVGECVDKTHWEAYIGVLFKGESSAEMRRVLDGLPGRSPIKVALAWQYLVKQGLFNAIEADRGGSVSKSWLQGLDLLQLSVESRQCIWMVLGQLSGQADKVQLFLGRICHGELPERAFVSLQPDSLDAIGKQSVLLGLQERADHVSKWDVYVKALFKGEITRGIASFYDRLPDYVAVKVALARECLVEKGLISKSSHGTGRPMSMDDHVLEGVVKRAKFDLGRVILFVIEEGVMASQEVRKTQHAQLGLLKERGTLRSLQPLRKAKLFDNMVAATWETGSVTSFFEGVFTQDDQAVLLQESPFRLELAMYLVLHNQVSHADMLTAFCAAIRRQLCRVESVLPRFFEAWAEKELKDGLRHLESVKRGKSALSDLYEDPGFIQCVRLSLRRSLHERAVLELLVALGARNESSGVVSLFLEEFSSDASWSSYQTTASALSTLFFSGSLPFKKEVYRQLFVAGKASQFPFRMEVSLAVFTPFTWMDGPLFVSQFQHVSRLMGNESQFVAWLAKSSRHSEKFNSLLGEWDSLFRPLEGLSLEDKRMIITRGRRLLDAAANVAISQASLGVDEEDKDWNERLKRILLRVRRGQIPRDRVLCSGQIRGEVYQVLLDIPNTVYAHDRLFSTEVRDFLYWVHSLVADPSIEGTQAVNDTLLYDIFMGLVPYLESADQGFDVIRKWIDILDDLMVNYPAALSDSEDAVHIHDAGTVGVGRWLSYVEVLIDQNRVSVSMALGLIHKGVSESLSVEHEGEIFLSPQTVKTLVPVLEKALGLSREGKIFSRGNVQYVAEILYRCMAFSGGDNGPAPKAKVNVFSLLMIWEDVVGEQWELHQDLDLSLWTRVVHGIATFSVKLGLLDYRLNQVVKFANLGPNSVMPARLPESAQRTLKQYMEPLKRSDLDGFKADSDSVFDRLSGVVSLSFLEELFHGIDLSEKTNTAFWEKWIGELTELPVLEKIDRFYRAGALLDVTYRQRCLDLICHETAKWVREVPSFNAISVEGYAKVLPFLNETGVAAFIAAATQVSDTVYSTYKTVILNALIRYTAETQGTIKKSYFKKVSLLSRTMTPDMARLFVLLFDRLCVGQEDEASNKKNQAAFWTIYSYFSPVFTPNMSRYATPDKPDNKEGLAYMDHCGTLGFKAVSSFVRFALKPVEELSYLSSYTQQNKEESKALFEQNWMPDFLNDAVGRVVLGRHLQFISDEARMGAGTVMPPSHEDVVALWQFLSNRFVTFDDYKRWETSKPGLSLGVKKYIEGYRLLGMPTFKEIVALVNIKRFTYSDMATAISKRDFGTIHYFLFHSTDKLHKEVSFVGDPKQVMTWVWEVAKLGTFYGNTFTVNLVKDLVQNITLEQFKAVDPTGDNWLCRAFMTFNQELVMIWLDKLKVFRPDYDKYISTNFLPMASYYGNVDSVQWGIDQGFDPKGLDMVQRNAILNAVMGIKDIDLDHAYPEYCNKMFVDILCLVDALIGGGVSFDFDIRVRGGAVPHPVCTKEVPHQCRMSFMVWMLSLREKFFIEKNMTKLQLMDSIIDRCLRSDQIIELLASQKQSPVDESMFSLDQALWAYYKNGLVTVLQYLKERGRLDLVGVNGEQLITKDGFKLVHRIVSYNIQASESAVESTIWPMLKSLHDLGINLLEYSVKLPHLPDIADKTPPVSIIELLVHSERFSILEKVVSLLKLTPEQLEDYNIEESYFRRENLSVKGLEYLATTYNANFFRSVMWSDIRLTVAYFAVCNGHIPFFEYLLRYHPEDRWDLGDNGDRTTLLYRAIKEDQQALAVFLAGALPLDCLMLCVNGKLLVDWAQERGFEDVCVILKSRLREEMGSVFHAIYTGQKEDALNWAKEVPIQELLIPVDGKSLSDWASSKGMKEVASVIDARVALGPSIIHRRSVPRRQVLSVDHDGHISIEAMRDMVVDIAPIYSFIAPWMKKR